ncbi:gamma-glutamyl-phosphate reductase, partial [Bacillus cereus]|nr:gamma-glutamyl-phosphate reductase [Bacillus cereus]
MSDLTTNTATTEENQFSEVRTKANLAKKSAGVMNRLTTAQKNEALLAMAEALVNHTEELIAANHNDLKHGREQGTSESLLDRLK